jgi:agmatine deiminase
LGAKEILWLPGDDAGATILGDDTDGHIDQLARFVDDSTIVYAWTEDANDPQRAGLENNLAQLKQQIKSIDTEYQFRPLPLPPTITHCDLRLPASYCNFLITNKSVLVPQFGAVDSDATIS